MGYSREPRYEDYLNFKTIFTFNDGTTKTVFSTHTPKSWDLFATVVNGVVSEGVRKEFKLPCDLNGVVTIDTTQLTKTEVSSSEREWGVTGEEVYY